MKKYVYLVNKTKWAKCNVCKIEIIGMFPSIAYKDNDHYVAGEQVALCEHCGADLNVTGFIANPETTEVRELTPEQKEKLIIEKIRSL